MLLFYVPSRYFYPRPPRGGRRLPSLQANSFTLFLSTPSARRATETAPIDIQQEIISIHALREEGDSCTSRLLTVWLYFYPRPPRGGRRCPDRPSHAFLSISIHALREEGDPLVVNHGIRSYRFLSTPSARRATRTQECYAQDDRHFYPRPPRGGRLTGDAALLPEDLFLSTPSARRATAKTERKPSAFVSLYTSLHKLQRDVCKPNRKITPLLAQTAGIPVRSVPENHVCCRFALAGHQKISTLSWANSGCSPTCSTLVW